MGARPGVCIPVFQPGLYAVAVDQGQIPPPRLAHVMPPEMFAAAAGLFRTHGNHSFLYFPLHYSRKNSGMEENATIQLHGILCFADANKPQIKSGEILNRHFACKMTAAGSVRGMAAVVGANCVRPACAASCCVKYRGAGTSSRATTGRPYNGGAYMRAIVGRGKLASKLRAAAP